MGTGRMISVFMLLRGKTRRMETAGHGRRTEMSYPAARIL